MTPSSRDGKRALIIGAGPAGLCAADELLNSGWTVTIVESHPTHVGGLARTEVFEGFRFDIGAHRFFTKNADIQRWWREQLGDDLLTVDRYTRILYRGKFFNYPLQLHNVFQTLGLLESARCAASFVAARLRSGSGERSYEDWIVRRFGRRLFETFFRTYTEKVWGMPCSDISADWAAQRIKGLSLVQLVSAAFGVKPRAVVRTLVDRFSYPRLGAGMLWERVRTDLEKRGAQFVLGERLIGLSHQDGRIVSAQTIDSTGRATLRNADVFVSTMPMAGLAQSFAPPLGDAAQKAAASLRYRDLLLVYMIIDRADVFPDHWIYIHDPSVRVGRIANFRNWSRDMVPDDSKTGLALDYFCNDGDDLWRQDDKAIALLATREIEKLGFASSSEVLGAKVLRVEKAYPVLNANYRDAVSIIRAAIDPFENLFLAGRNGMHKYNNQDHSMLTGRIVARAANGDSVSPWHVNIDAEYHESEPLNDAARATPELHARPRSPLSVGQEVA